MTASAHASTLYDKLWTAHAVHERADDGQTLLFIDRHLFHEGSARALSLIHISEPTRPY